MSIVHCSALLASLSADHTNRLPAGIAALLSQTPRIMQLLDMLSRLQSLGYYKCSNRAQQGVYSWNSIEPYLSADLLVPLAAKMSEEPFRLVIMDSIAANLRVDFTGRGDFPQGCCT